MQLDLAAVRILVARALAEDLGERGDITTTLCVPQGRQGSGRIVAKEAGILAGLEVARLCFEEVDPGVRLDLLAADGDRLEVGQVVLRVDGPAAALLAAERTALNLLQRMSAIATEANRFAELAAEFGVAVYDTRKTTPLLRMLEKYAVRVGGAFNHRIGLYDQVLLKENHFALAAPRSYRDVVATAVAGSEVPVIAEARDLGEAVAAVEGGALVVLLDNFDPGPRLTEAVQAVRAAAERLGQQVECEASGGIRKEVLEKLAACGIDRVSVGALTHTVRALDLSMLIEAAP